MLLPWSVKRLGVLLVSDNRSSEKVRSTDEKKVSPSVRGLTRPKKKESVLIALEKPVPTITKKKLKHSNDTANKTTDLAEMNSLKEFSKMWNGLVSMLGKRLKKCSTKEKKDILRLREAVCCFCKDRSEKNLSALVQMTSWLYFYYIPPSNTEETVNYKEMLKNGLFKQISTTSRRSQRLMETFRNFADDFKHFEKECST
ncbi:hypothetical protein COOONC_11873 [Cooperia oncophora]